MPGGRPRSEIRIALFAAAQRLQGAGVDGYTWRDLMDEADLTRRLSAREHVSMVKKCVFDMARAGELVKAGTVPTHHACRPMVVFRWAGVAFHSPEPAIELQVVMGAWLGSTSAKDGWRSGSDHAGTEVTS